MTAARDERGAVAVLMALSVVVLLGFGAMVVDVGALVQERRELQNGADAGALAVAKDCAGSLGCGDYGFTANDFVDANALDLDSNVDDVCGDPELPACADPPSLPEGVLGYVRVIDSTQEVSSGTNQITFSLGQVLGLTGATVDASAVAAWGIPAGATTTPLTISQCEFDFFADSDGDGVPDFDDQVLATIYFHNPSSNNPPVNERCPPGPAGQDEPGGFGWLDADGDCEADTSTDGTYSADTGNNVPPGCDPAQWLNTVVLIPIYSQVVNPGTNAAYTITGYGAFFVAGYKFPGNRGGDFSSCEGGTSCLVGYFTEYVGAGTEFGSGPNMGAVIVRMVG